ncbi:MAG: hypothetical protein FD127_4114 [Acidimicrobiaceae bacterium]|nr:MAG: hypothetical protein FD127_4114 [Acidimicrobiaceae bacterium]
MYATSIGASVSPDQDYSESTLPVVATLHPDGSAEWALLPEDWYLGASDVWGTVLAHVGQDSTVELAWLIGPDFEPSLPGYRTEGLDVEWSCAGNGACTGLAVDDEGTIVTFDPGTATMTVHETPARTFAVDIDTSAGGYLVEVTDADVAYLLAPDPAAPDPVGTLYAVSTAPSNAGDSDLVAGELGLVLVGCCAFDERRPPVAAPVVMQWVDSSGAPTTFGSDVMHIEFRSDGSADIVRNSPNDDVRRWTVPEVAMMRGMPPLAPLADGGAMAYLSDRFDRTSPSRLVVLRPDGTIIEHSIGGYFPVAIEPAGTLIVFDSHGGFSRLTLERD